MATTTDRDGPSARREDAAALGVAFPEFVALVALSMAVTALSIDIMLVALPDIAGEYALTDENDRQYVLTAYLVAYALGHLVAGPLSDRIGRKPVLIGGLLLYAAASVVAAFATSFEMLIAARIVQGLGGAGPRVVAIAVVRDRFSGRRMARVMSFAVTLFIMVPVVAPAIGSAIMLAGPWRLIFGFLALVGLALAAWIGLRLPETNPASRREASEPVGLGEAVREVLNSRQAVGYTIAIGFVFACIMTYIAVAQQMFADVFDVTDTLPAFFAMVAVCQAGAAFINASLVERVGMRRLSHAAMMAALAASALVFCLVVAGVSIGLWPALLFMATVFFTIGLSLPNFNAIAMEPLGRVAGTGSSLIGFWMSGAGAVLGTLVGQLYDGSLAALSGGFLAFSLGTVLAVAVTERGRLFAPAAERDGG